jgi:serine/threonine protein kinase
MDSKINQNEIKQHPEIQKRLNIINKQRFVGTAEYMAPEVILMKDVGLYTDLWSLGCIVYQIFMGHSPFHDKTEYLIFQNILNLDYYIDEEIVPQHAQDLIKNLLKTDPKERLGSGLTEDNNFDKLKNHKFFEDFDMKKYFSILEKYLNKSCKDVQFNQDDIKKKEISQSEKIISEEKPKEKILKVGILKKRSRWFYYDKRKIVLFNSPRIDYMDPDTNILKGSIPLTKECSAHLVSSVRFDLKTPNRDYVFMCKSKYDISPWVTAINDAINNFIV